MVLRKAVIDAAVDLVAIRRGLTFVRICATLQTGLSLTLIVVQFKLKLKVSVVVVVVRLS